MSRGGLYVWRTRKPYAVFGLPIIGRHFGYGGRTSSFYHREGQHLGQERNGGQRAERGPRGASWSDLSPKCCRIPFPDWMSATAWRRKNLVEPLETLMLWLICPVYNVDQQPPWNLRKIDRRRAASQRFLRDQAGPWLRVAMATIELVRLALAIGVVLLLLNAGWL